MQVSFEFDQRELRVGRCLVSPRENKISCGSESARVEPKIMAVLCALATAEGSVVSRDGLLDNVWKDIDCTEEVVTRAISQLRKAFTALDPSQTYIRTISKRGYVVSADVTWDGGDPSIPVDLTTSTKAYQLYLQGKSLNARINGDAVIPVAAKLLLEAVDEDPDFAEAHAELANSYTLMGTYVKGEAGPTLLEKTVNHARWSINKKPDLALPNLVLAIAEFTLGNIVSAIELNRAVVQREPRNPEALMRLGYFYAGVGLTKKAIPFLEEAVALDPAQGRNLQVLALAKLNNGDLDEADELAQRAIDLHHYFAYDTHAAIAFARGDYEIGVERALAGQHWMINMFDDKFDAQAWEKACDLCMSPKREDRLTLADWLMLLLGRFEHTPEVPLLQGLIRCGAPEHLFKVMEDCLPLGRHGSYLSLWADTEPCRDIYHHPRFLAFADRTGMRPVWEKFGWPDRLLLKGKGSKTA